MKKKAIILTIFYIVLQLLDGLLTWIGTPDLALEANLLVSHFGLGWIALFVANVLFTCLFAGLAYYSFAIYKPQFIDSQGRRQYIKELFSYCSEHSQKASHVFNWRSFWAVFGYAFCYGLIASRIFLVWEWSMFILNIPVPFYDKMWAALPIGRWDIVLAIIVAVFCICFWFQKQYRNNKALRSKKLLEA